MSSGGARRDSTSHLPEMVSPGYDLSFNEYIITEARTLLSIDGTIIIWHQVESRAEIATFGEDEEEEKAHEREFWKEKRMIV